MSDINDKAEAEEAAHYDERMSKQYEAEIERLREALREMVGCADNASAALDVARQIAKEALDE